MPFLGTVLSIKMKGNCRFHIEIFPHFSRYTLLASIGFVKEPRHD